MKDIYNNGEFLKNNPSWGIEDSPWKAKQIMKLIKANNINLASIKSICEVGCGAGEILNQLSQQMPANISFYGYEISRHAFELCRLRENDNLHFFLKDLLEEEDSFFDIILAIDLVEHIEDYCGFLRKLKNKGKYKIFHIPLDISAQTVLRSTPLIMWRRLQGHVHYFTKDTALASLLDTGYNIIDYFYTPSAVRLRPRTLRMFLARYPRKILFLLNKELLARLLGGLSLIVLAE